MQDALGINQLGVVLLGGVRKNKLKHNNKQEGKLELKDVRVNGK